MNEEIVAQTSVVERARQAYADYLRAEAERKAKETRDECLALARWIRENVGEIVEIDEPVYWIDGIDQTAYSGAPSIGRVRLHYRSANAPPEVRAKWAINWSEPFQNYFELPISNLFDLGYFIHTIESGEAFS